MSSRLLPISTVALFLLASALLAQGSGSPTAYRITLTNSTFGPTETITVSRSGSKALVDEVSSAKFTVRPGVHTRTLYDLDAHTSTLYTWPNATGGCSTAPFSGDWGDPFTAAADYTGPDANLADIETIRGSAVNVMTSPAPDQSTAKAWIDNKTGLLIKAQLVPPSGDPHTILEVTDVSLTAPPPSTFALPPNCTSNQPTSAQPQAPDQQLTVYTGGTIKDYLPATTGPASADSCVVLFHIVRAGNMAPITRGFQEADDLSYNSKRPASYTVGVTPEGRVTFGGGLVEVTPQLHEGVLHLENPPTQFEIDTEFANAGAGHALLYRQCFAPQTELLYVVRNPARLSDGGLWLWVKSGKKLPTAH